MGFIDIHTVCLHLMSLTQEVLEVFSHLVLRFQRKQMYYVGWKL